MSKDSDRAEDRSEVYKIGDTLKNCLNCGIIVVSEQGVVVSINSDAVTMLQVKSSELLNQPVSKLPESVYAAYEETLKTGKNVSDGQILLPSYEPQERRLSLKTTLIPQSQNSWMVIQLADMGAARKLEHNMRRLDRLASVGTLSAGYAHELKNALVPVNTFLELMNKENQNHDLSDTAFKGIKRINSLVQQLNHLSAPTKPRFIPVHIHDVLDQSLTFVQYLLKENSIELKYELQAERDRVEADAYQLEQAFLNMLFNALDAMGPGGTLRIESLNIAGEEDSSSEALQVCIHDTGVGIPPENMNRLFDTFFTTKPHGTGLGLSISRRIVMEHGGDIQIKSNLNEGTSVLISLPVFQRK